MKMLWYSVFSFLHFGLDWTVRKVSWMEVTLVFIMAFFWKYHSERYLVTAIFKFFSTISRQDTLLLKILWTWVYVRANSFIKTSVNMNRKSTRKHGKLSVAQKSKHLIRRLLHHYFYMLRFLPNKLWFLNYRSAECMIFATIVLPFHFWSLFAIIWTLMFTLFHKNR